MLIKKSEELINDSLKILEPFGTKADTLVKLTKFIISKGKIIYMFLSYFIDKDLSNKRLDIILYKLNLVSSRQRALSLIINGKVLLETIR